MRCCADALCGVLPTPSLVYKLTNMKIVNSSTVVQKNGTSGGGGLVVCHLFTKSCRVAVSQQQRAGSDSIDERACPWEGVVG